MELTPSQLTTAKLIAQLSVQPTMGSSSILLKGAIGCGKRTIAQGAATLLELRFVEIPLHSSPATVLDTLLGTREESLNARRGGPPPGELGRNTGTLFYLSHLESCHESLDQLLFRLFARREYVDRTGETWGIDSTCVLVSSVILDTRAALRIAPDHWLCTAFGHRTEIKRPDGDLVADIFTRMVREHPVRLTVDQSCFAFIASFPELPHNLHSVRRWAETIVSQTHDADRTLSLADFESEIAREYHTLASGLRFNGQLLSLAAFQEWWNQFPIDIRPLLAHLFRAIALDYYVSEHEISRAVDECLAHVATESYRTGYVVYGGPLGPGSGVAVRSIKERVRGVCHEVDLATCARLQLQPQSSVIVLVGFLTDITVLRTILLELAEVDDASVSILILAATDSACRAIGRDTLMTRVPLRVNRLITLQDECLSDTSTIIQSAVQRARLRQFLKDTAFLSEFPPERLGSREFSLLIVLPNHVPRETLPIVWYENRCFRALFPSEDIHLHKWPNIVVGRDGPDPVDPGARPTVFLLHGIKTRGVWQKSVVPLLNQAGMTAVPLDYGYFFASQFVFKRARRKKLEWFLDEYTKQCNRLGCERPSIIAHSFGSYLVAHALEKYRELQFDKVILCGAIVRSEFAWEELAKAGQMRALLNQYGGRDIWARIAAWIVPDTGPSGVTGFEGQNDYVVQQSNESFGHSDYFYDLNFRHNWIPFLLGKALTPAPNRGYRRFNWRVWLVRAIVFAAIAVFLFWGLPLIAPHWRWSR